MNWRRTLPGHCLAIMLASWRGQSLVPAANVAGLERAFNPARHPELAPKRPVRDAILSESALRTAEKIVFAPSTEAPAFIGVES